MMIGQAPRSGIDVEPRIEAAFLSEPAELGISVAAPQRPVAAARARVVLENLNPVARLAQLVSRDHPRNARAEHQNRGSRRRTAQLNRALVTGVGGKAQAGHRLIHGGASRRYR